MAIKIAGTTVVDDSRALTNIATVDATTAAAISAAGVGGGGEHDFVASGAIANGDVVAVNADGTVSIIQDYNFSLTEEANVATGETGRYAGITTDGNGTVFLGYTNSTNSTMYGMAGTVSGSTITWGTAVSLGVPNPAYTSVTYDPDQDVFIVAANSSAVARAVACSVTGTTITAGSPVSLNMSLGLGQNVYTSLAYSPSDQKTIWVTTDWNDGKKLHALHITATGTSLSLGTPFEITTLNTENFSVTCDNSGNIFVVYKDSASPYYGRIDHLVVNGSSFTKSAATTIFRSGHAATPSASYDILEDKILIAWRDLTAYRGYSIAASWDGSSFSFGSIYEFDNSHNVDPLQLIYSQEKKAHLLVYYGGRDATVLKVDGDTITEPVSDITLTANANDTLLNSKTFAYDNSLDKFVGVAADYSSQTQYSIILNYDFDNNISDYIGIAAEDIADTATGAVTIDGGVTPSKTINNYDLANASYDSVSFSVAAQETFPTGLFFKPDGTKMYVIGEIGTDINEYTLSTAWDITSASYVQTFSVSSQESEPKDLFFKSDGTKLYVVGINGDDINEYDLSTAWDISSTSYSQNFSVASQAIAPNGLFFKPDGTKMYVCASDQGFALASINEYSLSTAWDVSTATLTTARSYNSLYPVYEAQVNAISFNSSGTRMYILGANQDTVVEYTLSTPWSISTASNSSAVTFSVASQETTPQGLFFKSDGTKMYIVGIDSDTVYQYSAGTFGGYTINASQFVADNGSLTTTNNGRKIGKAISTSELLVDSAMTGDETNEYLGSLV